MNEGLFTAYRNRPEWKKLLESLNPADCTVLYDVAEGERPFLAAALMAAARRPVVLVAPTEIIAQRQAQDIERLTGMRCAALPARDIQFSRAAMSRESAWQRIEVLDAMLSGKLRAICLSVDCLLDRCAPRALFESAEITVAEGERHAPEKLLNALIQNGYERMPMVEGRGQCAMRGSILDVFPSNEVEAVRIEFFDDEVDSIRRFDCISQRSIARVKSVRLAPATECLLDHPEAAAERLRAAVLKGVGHEIALSLEARKSVRRPALGQSADAKPLQTAQTPAVSQRATRPSEPMPENARKSAAQPASSSSKTRPAANTGRPPENPADDRPIEELPDLDTFLSELDAIELAEDTLKTGEKPAATRLTKAKPSRTPAPAAAEKPLTDDELSYKRHLDDVDRVRAGQCIRTAPMWMNVLCTDTVPVTEYFTDPIILCDRPDQFAPRLRAKADEFAEAFDEALMRSDAFDDQKTLRFTYDEILADWRRRPVVAFSDMLAGLGMLQPGNTISIGSQPAMPYQGQLEPLRDDIVKWKEAGCAIVLLTGGEARGLRLQKSLNELNVPSSCADTLDGNLIAREVILLPVSYGKGFLNPGAGLCVLSDSDIYGSSYQRARKKQYAGERIASFTDLKTGDYVVHELHGVGIYRGVIQMVSEGVKRDYLLIQYADNDKLYVPADQFDRVQKFIGAEHNTPKLNRIGGTEWARQKSRVKAGLKKLAFDLVALYAKRAKNTGYAFSHENPWRQEFNDMFPYELTVDQAQCVEQIEADMESPRNMDRLLCGDVGYGKTEVALRAAFKAVVEGKQVAILAPTTILVQQHYNTIRKRFSGFAVKCDMLSRFRTPKEQKEIIAQLKAGELDLVVGTHRLLAKDVQFKDLGLLIVDEEHRFGVNHKESIKNLKSRVDVLTLSATPIPRTLHMSMVGIRDMSLLETPPEERLPVKTYVIDYNDALVRDAVRREMARGGQVYFLYNRVRSIEQMRDRIQTLVPDARIGIAHGQMSENALEDIMLDFYAGAYDVLLCTTIVESGLDVPEANTLIVFDADHFGLSQLYQIRGRVGRSNKQAYAYLTVRANKQLSETADKRLTAIREFTEFGAGYRIAMRDLEIRGAGDVLGPEQSGHLSAVGYDMYVKLIEQAVGEAQGVEQTPELDTRVELRLDAYLPEDYVHEESLRVEIYKRIAMIDDEAARLDIEEELIDRFGDIPQPVQNLMRIAELRGVTRRLGVAHLFTRPDGVHLRLDENFVPNPELFCEAVKRTDGRMRFGTGKTPELVVAQRDLTAEKTLDLCIPMLTKVHDELKKLAAKENA